MRIPPQFGTKFCRFHWLLFQPSNKANNALRARAEVSSIMLHKIQCNQLYIRRYRPIDRTRPAAGISGCKYQWLRALTGFKDVKSSSQKSPRYYKSFYRREEKKTHLTHLLKLPMSITEQYIGILPCSDLLAGPHLKLRRIQPWLWKLNSKARRRASLS